MWNLYLFRIIVGSLTSWRRTSASWCVKCANLEVFSAC